MDIESSVRDMISSLKTRCPTLSPALFLTHFTPKTLEHLCSTPAQIEQVKSWLSKQEESSHSFVTEIDYAQRTIRIVEVNSVNEVDAALSSLESTMRMLVVGDEMELTVAMTRFLEINGYKGDIPGERHIFNECYNIAYALKILISNTPGMKVLMADQELPFDSEVNVGQILNKINEKRASVNDDSDDDDDSTKKLDNAGKKRKRKRGKVA